MSLAVVVAAYDERENVEELTRRIHATLSALGGWSWEIVYVVEGADGTREIVERLMAELGGIRLLYQERPLGIGHAFRRGFASLAADSDYVVTLDADLNHQPEEIPRLLAAAQASGADVLVGSRLVRGGRIDLVPLWKRLLSASVNRLMRVLYGLPVADKTSGFRVYRAAALRGLGFRNDGFAFLPELLMAAQRAGLRLHEEPIHFVFRRRGRSKMAFFATSLSYLSLLAPQRRYRALPRVGDSSAKLS